MSEPLAPSGPRGRTARLHDPDRRGFYWDNHSGIHPDVLAAIAAANEGHQPGYGADVYTARMQDVVAEQFGAGSEAYPVSSRCCPAGAPWCVRRPPMSTPTRTAPRSGSAGSSCLWSMFPTAS